MSSFPQPSNTLSVAGNQSHDGDQLRHPSSSPSISAYGNHTRGEASLGAFRNPLGPETQASSTETTAIRTVSDASEDNPWSRKTLLTFDGGGVRGYSSLLILRAIVVKIAAVEQELNAQATSSIHPLLPRPRKPVRAACGRIDTSLRNRPTHEPLIGPLPASSHYLPCHYFDYIAGTSTGGLIAIMLGRLSMTVDECLDVYESLADEVFGHPRHFHVRRPPWYPAREKYNHKQLERVIKEIVSQRNPAGHGYTMFRQPATEMCRTICIAWQKFSLSGTRVPYLFRSYRHPRSTNSDVLERNPDAQDEYKIWEVGRATSAAPTYFKAMKIDEDNEKSEFVDGGFGANNPTEEAYRSIQQLSNNDPRALKVVVSIGTGKNLETDPHPNGGYGQILWYLNAAAKWATQSEGTHDNMIHNTRRDGAQYFRLNVEHGIGKMKLDAWKGSRGNKTLELLRTKTDEYLASPEGELLVSKTARELVTIRQARANPQADPDRWERFCHGVEYACPVAPCNEGEKRWTRRDLQRHLQDLHPARCNIDRLEHLLESGKCFPEETAP